MRVFVTGATGFVGSAVVQELIGAGHQVLGLARSDVAAVSLAAAGAAVHRGHLEDLESLRSGAAAADGVIHTGFIHDFSRFKENCEIDRRAIETLALTLAASDRPLVITSGTGLLPKGRLTTEEDAPTAASPRIASEEAAAAAASQGVRAITIRLPPSVHGDGDHGFVPLLIGIAREKGVSVYTGEGGNLWAAVHRFDAAKLYRLALEKGKAGARYHGVAEEGVRFREIAEVIGHRLNVPVVSKSSEEAAVHFGWFAHFAAIDNLASSKRTREEMGWQATGPGLISDIDRPVYFGG
ncbi:Nucleoside-diphosphate-sugar epimerase [Rhizobium tibeticum]|uniref:Hopanoid-associated sugar epimerase n=1 Tax=Rhizobium tibeticum TaxID=501024 RepID=A0A1H8ESY9_9HYPH|nr:SDR family oxidoreductase [Rhizobium tibeticum]SEH38080.1 hopanoid-associated sugar epimerase [Rhizobium tibeticum]SEN21997.1 Nucleoside-diphosphate-sugar epimerase [Rhizobium tibeticum]